METAPGRLGGATEIRKNAGHVLISDLAPFCRSLPMLRSNASTRLPTSSRAWPAPALTRQPVQAAGCPQVARTAATGGAWPMSPWADAPGDRADGTAAVLRPARLPAPDLRRAGPRSDRPLPAAHARVDGDAGGHRGRPGRACRRPRGRAAGRVADP